MRQRLGLVGLGALLLVIAEIAVFVLVSYAIGVLWTLLLLLATMALGAWLLRREGVRAWRSFRARAGAGQPVGADATTGLVGLLAAVLLLVPGFLTDVVGLALLVPPVRRLAGAGVRRYAERRLPSSTAGDLFGPRRVRVRVRRGAPPPSDPTSPGPAGGEVVEGEIIDPQ